ncbi:coiled-coil and C2 domain-containing protein 1-like [Xenia sp. Carnegie-2017]|uniref:coiled-coil and C2 domain-containing protein 1-like n=1 Tax=Xenia sp. Carnegie-2017 TaxID=2897299 RepID=UPI001F04BEAA|nr:coiled-coil and C2 domain-containing protein 1-like [Xenia sp. Carnegie-2017]
MFKQKKSSSRPSSGPKKRDLDMIGGLGMNVGIDPMTMFGDGDENDDDLEAELAALRGGQPQQKQRRPKRNLMDISSIDAMAAECMKDIDYTEDEDINDPDLLAELDSLTPLESTPSLDGTPVLLPTKARREAVPGKELPKQSGGDVVVITERKAMYETAIANAEKAGDGGKARRFKRGLKTIDKMLKALKVVKKLIWTNCLHK